MTKITLPPKKYYRLPEIAKIWGCEVDDILDYAEQYLLIVCARHCDEEIKCSDPDTDDAGNIPLWEVSTTLGYDLFKLDVGAIRAVRNRTTQREDGAFPFIVEFREPIVTCYERTIGWVHGYFMKNKMVITHEEKERFESLGIEQLSKEELLSMPEELSWCLKAWQALYRDKGISNKRGHKDQIEAWLTKKNPSLSKEAIKRIATVVNIRKSGGQLKLDKFF